MGSPYDYTDLIINEILYSTVGTDAGCFIEIYNSGSSSINLDDESHDIIIEGVNGQTGQQYVAIDLVGIISQNDYYVLAQDVTVANYDQIDTDADFQNGPDGLRLVDNSTGTQLDGLQYGDAPSGTDGCLEGNYAPLVSEDSSLARDISHTDTDDNSADFYENTSPSPGVANFIPELDLIITEIFYNSVGADVGCFIEIFNEGSTSVDLDDVSHDIIIEGVNGATGLVYVTLDLNGTIAASDYYVLAQNDTVANYDQINPGANLQNGPDGLRLVDNTTGIQLDGLQYGDAPSGTDGCLEGNYAPLVPEGSSLARDMSNTDTDDNSADFYESSTPTPGVAGTIPEFNLSWEIVHILVFFFMIGFLLSNRNILHAPK
ncbi:MAG: lamin tail domain-containing protein [Promethearchaeota archaeon]